MINFLKLVLGSALGGVVIGSVNHFFGVYFGVISFIVMMVMIGDGNFYASDSKIFSSED
jgi:hypothetical protein